MGLAEAIADVFMGRRSPPKSISIGLALGMSELDDSGYSPIVVPMEKWKKRDGKWVAEVEFGPFVNSVAFDTQVLSALGQTSFGQIGEVRLPKGSRYVHQALLESVEAPGV